jgi:hypothetical protein
MFNAKSATSNAVESEGSGCCLVPLFFGDTIHKSKIRIRSDFQKLKEEKSYKSSKVYKKFQRKISFIVLQSFYLYQL